MKSLCTSEKSVNAHSAETNIWKSWKHMIQMDIHVDAILLIFGQSYMRADTVGWYTLVLKSSRRKTMTKIIITILAAVVVISALIVYSCCVVAGRSDDAAERWMREHDR